MSGSVLSHVDTGPGYKLTVRLCNEGLVAPLVARVQPDRLAPRLFDLRSVGVWGSTHNWADALVQHDVFPGDLEGARATPHRGRVERLRERHAVLQLLFPARVRGLCLLLAQRRQQRVWALIVSLTSVPTAANCCLADSPMSYYRRRTAYSSSNSTQGCHTRSRPAGQLR